MDGKRLALGRNAVRPAVDCFDKPPPIVINTARRQGGHELNGRRYSSILARCRWGGVVMSWAQRKYFQECFASDWFTRK